MDITELNGLIYEGAKLVNDKIGFPAQKIGLEYKTWTIKWSSKEK